MSKIITLALTLLLCLSSFGMNKASQPAKDWQWSIAVPGEISAETNMLPRAFLWIPPHCQRVRAVVVGMHNMIEEGIFENPIFRRAMDKLEFAVVWVSPIINGSQSWEGMQVQQSFEQMMSGLAKESGYEELKYAPIVPLGHSAQATYPWNFAACNPQRTLAVLSIHGDAPQTNLTGYGRKNMDWNNRSIDGIPGLMVEGEYEWWEDRVQPALNYRMAHPRTPISFLCDAGRGHFDYSDGMINYICLFLQKAARYRLPVKSSKYGPVVLNPVIPQKGWLAERWHPGDVRRNMAAPYHYYKGDAKDAFWYFDKEMAMATENYYASQGNKLPQYIGFVQGGKLLEFDVHDHARTIAKWEPEADGVTFHIRAIYTDTLRRRPSSEHADRLPVISRICGPVEKVNDSTFTVRFYRMGMNNAKRSHDIWLLAMNDGNQTYKSAVQQAVLHFPSKNTEGTIQHIDFPLIPNIKKGIKSISLHAVSDSGMPVYYYVQEGPAEIRGNRLMFTDIPVRAKLPIKVTVVAWQYGCSISPKVQTAEPVVHSFYYGE